MKFRSLSETMTGGVGIGVLAILGTQALSNSDPFQYGIPLVSPVSYQDSIFSQLKQWDLELGSYSKSGGNLTAEFDVTSTFRALSNLLAAQAKPPKDFEEVFSKRKKDILA